MNKPLLFLVLSGLLNTSAFAQTSLQKPQILLTDSTLAKNQCIVEQDFAAIGPEDKALYGYKIVMGDKTRGECERAYVNAALYRKVNNSYQKLWEHGYVGPAHYVFLNLVAIRDDTVLIYDYADGGNAGHSYQEAYVVSDAGMVVRIDESEVKVWVNSRLQDGQRVMSNGGGISYDSDGIIFKAKVFNQDDNIRQPSGGDLLARMRLVKSSSGYRLELLNSYNTGKSQDLYEQGLKQYKRKQYRKAVNSFKKATKENPKNWKAWTNLGMALLTQGQFVKAVDACRNVLNSDRSGSVNKGNAAYNMGLAYEKLGNLTEALFYYEMSHNFVKSKHRSASIEKVKAKLASSR
ncbi:MAG: tetratricopeptide repeat protein [Gammaproteobacteria bacterium]|nr:tetratricopeptide repeat protein [Gammaproteobacteria bacterium]MDH5802204.1 tetratricopeptide repeat protein [Gammaproteobacteria bacterium]